MHSFNNLIYGLYMNHCPKIPHAYITNIQNKLKHRNGQTNYINVSVEELIFPCFCDVHFQENRYQYLLVFIMRVLSGCSALTFLNKKINKLFMIQSPSSFVWVHGDLKTLIYLKQRVCFAVILQFWHFNI